MNTQSKMAVSAECGNTLLQILQDFKTSTIPLSVRFPKIGPRIFALTSATR